MFQTLNATSSFRAYSIDVRSSTHQTGPRLYFGQIEWTLVKHVCSVDEVTIIEHEENERTTNIKQIVINMGTYVNLSKYFAKNGGKQWK